MTLNMAFTASVIPYDRGHQMGIYQLVFDLKVNLVKKKKIKSINQKCNNFSS